MPFAASSLTVRGSRFPKAWSFSSSSLACSSWISAFFLSEMSVWISSTSVTPLAPFAAGVTPLRSLSGTTSIAFCTRATAPFAPFTDAPTAFWSGVKWIISISRRALRVSSLWLASVRMVTFFIGVIMRQPPYSGRQVQAP